MNSASGRPVFEVHEGRNGLVANAVSRRIRDRHIVNDVSLQVSRGEVVALLGRNGAGKTSTFHVLSGLQPADSGTVSLDGHDITHWPLYRRARHGIAYLPQQPSVFRNMTTENNIRSVLETTDRVASRREELLDQLLTDFSLLGVRRSSALSLSGGERRRVEIARALATKPSFLLLDEPFAGIDPIFVDEMRSMIAHIKDRQIGVLITEHNVRDILEIVDRAYVLHVGRILTQGTPTEILRHEDVRRFYLGERFQM